MWFLLAFLSALFSAAAAVTQKRVLFGMTALQFSAVLAAANLLLSIPLFLLPETLSVGALPLLVLLGKTLLGAIAFVCVMDGIRRLELSSALPVMVLTPGLTALGAWVVLGEELGGAELAGMGMLMLGTYLLELKRGVPLTQPFTMLFRSRGHHVLGIALLLFSATAVVDKLLIRDLVVPPHALIAWQHCFLVPIFSLFLLLRRESPFAVLRAVPRDSWKLILLVAFCTLAYRLAQVEAVALAPVALVLSVKRLSVLIATLAAGRLFKEEGVPRKTAAVIVMLAGAMLVL